MNYQEFANKRGNMLQSSLDGADGHKKSLTHWSKDRLPIMYALIGQGCPLMSHIIGSLSFKQCITGFSYARQPRLDHLQHIRLLEG